MQYHSHTLPLLRLRNNGIARSYISYNVTSLRFPKIKKMNKLKKEKKERNKNK
jgi:hypothetical protein